MIGGVTTGMLQGQDPKVTEREIAAMPNGKPAVANLVDRIEAATGRRLEPSVKDRLASVLHYALGIVPGALYGLLRRFPIVGAKRGLVYGVLLWLLNDELLNTALGLAAPPQAYPLESHARGLVGHIVLGITTDAGIDILGG